jgi:ATP-dependent DNA helicase RecG
VVGTHALFSRDVLYHDLRLAVIDEQHRFGVLQRQAIMAIGGEKQPHLLMMSATPIPRSLALTVFGDLDVSIIRDMPAGRQPIETYLVWERKHKSVYQFVREQLDKGKQAYFVCPVIEGGSGGNSELEMKDVETLWRELNAYFSPQYPCVLVHSRLPEDEKAAVMEAFRKGEVKVLAATSVVEVGVDVPAATCMVIFRADRFGLSALHQLRGRVGRGADKSYCFLIYGDPGRPYNDPGDGLNEDAKARLRLMKECRDGFVIAEEDLKLRGPGAIAGVEQSGYLRLGLADPARDREVLELAREDAFAALAAGEALIDDVLTSASPFQDSVGV